MREECIMETPPKPKIIYEDYETIEFEGRQLSCMFSIRDHGRYQTFDLSTKKSDIPRVDIYGNFCGERSYISHIEILPLTGRGKNLGSSALALLERKLLERGVRLSFAAFRKPRTLMFMLKKGYRFVTQDEFTDQIISESGGCLPEISRQAEMELTAGEGMDHGRDEQATNHKLALLVKDLALKDE